MTVGIRLKEERVRLGFSQTDFAALADAKKGTQISWEKDSSSPTAQALVAFAGAGADVLYILTGRRTADRPDDAATQIEDQLADIRRDLIDPTRHKMPDETDERAEERTITRAKNSLKAILNYDTSFLTPDAISEVEHLLDIAENEVGLSLYRAADKAFLRKRREKIKKDLSEYFVGGDYVPNDVTMYLMTAITIEHGVPSKLLTELAHEIFLDARGSIPSK